MTTTFTDEINNNISDHASNNSVESLQNEMNSYSLEKLMKEPQQLAKHKANTIAQMKSLALQHYQLFIDNYNTLNFTHNQMDIINNRVDSLLDHLQSISSSCESFSTMSNQLVIKRTSVKNLLDNFPTILDLLEIPQLMDTCVKNGFYDEALQLESYAKKISKQYPNIKVISEIMSEVQKSTQSLILFLQQQLRGNISLTDCIRTIGFLRRLSIYKENELKTILLHSRDQWLMNSIKYINDSNPVSYLTKLTDCCRTNIFDIVTQFNAIFSDESDDESQLDDLILNGWVQQKTQFYLATLEKTLPLIKEGSSIGYILENSMYYSMSMSRVGIDFRGLLLPIFEKVITGVFLSQITTATHHFLEALKSYKFQQHNIKESSTTTTSPTATNHLVPPNSLLRHPPLAILTNSFLSAYMELKECAPLSLEYPLSIKLRDTLVTLTSGVQSYHNQSSLTLAQQPIFNDFCKCIVEDFIPFIVNCFDSIFCNNSKTPLIEISGLINTLTKIYITPQQQQQQQMLQQQQQDQQQAQQQQQQQDQQQAQQQSNVVNNTNVSSPPSNLLSPLAIGSPPILSSPAVNDQTLDKDSSITTKTFDEKDIKQESTITTTTDVEIVKPTSTELQSPLPSQETKSDVEQLEQEQQQNEDIKTEDLQHGEQQDESVQPQQDTPNEESKSNEQIEETLQPTTTSDDTKTDDTTTDEVKEEIDESY